MENLFTSSPVVWFALVASMVALPLLIHLINLLRHKKVEWAAMEFLLRSHKKNRNLVWLKQLLLLLSRIAVLLIGLFLLAQVGCQDDRISKLLGGSTTHHYILLDDSFSMSDQSNTGSVFNRARETLSLIAARAKNRQNQKITLIRYSSARGGSIDPANFDAANGKALNGESERGSAKASFAERLPSVFADLNGELIDDRFGQKVEDLKSTLAASNLSLGIDEAVQIVKQQVVDREHESSIVYVISDFRQRDWKSPEFAALQFREIHESGAAVELIRCATEVRQNLAITSLSPAGNVRVAGIPLMMEVVVRNCSSLVAEKIQLKISTMAVPSATRGNSVSTRIAELPAIFIQSLPPGESVSRQFPVYFDATGSHVIFADLPDDAVQVDNRRWSTVVFKSGANVLLIDDEQQKHSRYLALALNPGRMTGIKSEIHTQEFLRNASLPQLNEFETIFLLDVDSLESSAVENLESYVQAGGGLAFFCGPKTNFEFCNSQLFRNGTGLLPMPFAKAVEIPELLQDKIPDVSPNSHPIFSPISNVNNSLLDLVQISRIVEPTLDWLARSGDVPRTETVLATVRGQAGWPLVVEKPFGNGRVISFNSTAGPIWNNWSRNATFPAVLLLMQDYLAEGRFESATRIVGNSIKVELPANEFLPQASFFLRAGGQAEGASNIDRHFETALVQSDGDPEKLIATIGERDQSSSLSHTETPGIYDLALTTNEGAIETRRYAVNVDASESEMELADAKNLINRLEASRPSLVDWHEFSPEPKQKASSAFSRLLLFIMIGLLIAEQWLGNSASYHR